MDTMGSQVVTKGTYTIKLGDEMYKFHGVEMPPPSGVFGTNYTRFVVIRCTARFHNKDFQVHTLRGISPQVCYILDHHAGA